jgi:crotonobetainyl-CoA:carnitine CoA-transferase CaiB-like acyl-CoA transferase
VTPSAGEDAWVAISLRSAEELALVALVVDADLSAAVDDAARAAVVRAATEAWAASRSDDEAAAALRAAGVVAVPVRSGDELLEDEHLRARGWWQETDAPGGGTERQRGWAVSFEAGGPGSIRRNGPRIGQDTVEVLGELGYDEREITSLLERAVVSVPVGASDA